MKRIILIVASTIFLCGLLLVLLRASPQKDTDSFYSSSGDWDSLRFPLVKPYEAVKIETINGWFINLHLPFEQRQSDMKSYSSIDGIEKIYIENKIIMIYTPLIDDTAVSVNDKIVHWFVIIPSEKLVTGFENEDEFKEFIVKYGVYEIDWKTPDDIYNKFQNTKCLDWIPDCN